MSDIHSCMEGMFSEHEQIFLLVDATSGRAVTVEARKRAVAWPHAHRLAGAAIFGARIASRAAATILAAVVKIFYPASAIHLEFTATEAAARAWIDTRRRQPRSGRAAGGA